MDTEEVQNAPRNKGGRPKGSRNKVREEVAAAPVENQVRAPQAERKRTAGGGDADILYVDQARIPPHMDYNWKRLTFGGKEDNKHQINMAQHGAWTPVPRSRHPEIVGYNPKDPGEAIVVEGLMLMERPKKLSDEARAEDRMKAKAQVQGQLESLRLTQDGTLPRKVNKLNRKYDLAVPEDDNSIG